MKYCLAWPDACPQEKILDSGPNSNDNLKSPDDQNSNDNLNCQTLNDDALVVPKSLVVSHVEKTVDRLLQEVFDESKADAASKTNAAASDIASVKQDRKSAKRKSHQVIRYREDHNISHEDREDRAQDRAQESIESKNTNSVGQDVKSLWIVLGTSIAILLLLFFSVLQKVQSLEAWLHGHFAVRA
jgi:hypothetical protein